MPLSEERKELIRDFVNKLAFELKPSNDTMNAIRLFREKLPHFLDQELLKIEEEVKASERLRATEIISKVYLNTTDIKTLDALEECQREILETSKPKYTQKDVERLKALIRRGKKIDEENQSK